MILVEGRLTGLKMSFRLTYRAHKVPRTSRLLTLKSLPVKLRTATQKWMAGIKKTSVQ